MERIYISKECYEPAVEVLQKVLEQDKTFVSEVFPMLETCYRNLLESDA